MAPKFLFFAIIFFMISSCTKDKIATVEYPPFRLLHLSHTRTQFPHEIPPSLFEIDYDSYDLLCLGGDIDQNTSSSDSTMQLWDSLLDFKDPNTLWALGNHDVSDRELIRQYTERPSFYSWSNDFLTVVVLDSELASSSILDEQLTLVESVIDTISADRSLILLTHKLIWMPGHPELEPMINDVANGGFGSCGYCTSPNNFYQDIYPLLINAQEKGVTVICLAGDIGAKVAEFEYVTSDSIFFLASGIDYRRDVNKMLIFEGTKEENYLLRWWYKILE